MDQSITVKDALKIAITEEIKAYNLYMKTSKKVSSASTKQMLLELAEQEQGHRKLLENVVKKENYQRLGDNIPKESHGITEFLVVSELKEHATPQDVMIFAMKEEEKAFNFYTDLKNHFAGTDLEELFDKLAAEERSHKIKLEEEYEEHFLKEN